MIEGFLFRLDTWVITLLVAGALALGVECGFRLGRRAEQRHAASPRSPLGTVLGSVLGILALLLGFSFAMSAGRFQDRRELVVAEANAIGTASLRAALLPEPHGTAIAGLLRSYVDARLHFSEAGADEARLEMAVEETRVLQDRIWSEAVAAARAQTPTAATGLALASLNEVIDLHGFRLAALENHVPEAVLWLLIAAAMLSMGLVGYACGQAGNRHALPVFLTAALVTAALLLIVDLDRPQRGLIRVSESSLLELRDDLDRAAR